MKRNDVRPTVPAQRGEQFIGTLSHQLKSPINTINSLLKTIADGFTGDINDKTRHFIEKAIGKTAEANTLIADLLTFQQYTGAGQAASEEFDCTNLTRTIAGAYMAEASDREVFLRTRLPDHVAVFVKGSVRGFEIALRNLIENAIKYTPAHGHIVVRAMTDKSRKRCLISVADSGSGIPQAELSHVFDPFYRSVKHQSAAAGTGLGLSITRNIITSMGGDIRVESRENAGSVFTIDLPCVRIRSMKDGARAQKRVVIIGGVTAGPKTAARLRRLCEDLDITIIEKGEFLSYSGCGLPSYIAGRVFSPKALMSTADNTIRDISFFETIRKIKILNKTEATDIDRKRKTVGVKDLATGESWRVPYDALVLATGANSFLPPIPGIRLPGIYSLHRMEDAEAIKRECMGRNARDVCIIGGGLIGIETAESLIEAGARVTILEKKEHILSTIFDRDISGKIQNAMKKKGIKIVVGTAIKRIARRGEQLVFSTDKGKFFADLVILSAGVVPNARLAKKAGLACTPVGAVKVDRHLQTSDKSIYAIGDCAASVNCITRTQEYWPLGSISTKMGRIAADNICGRKAVFDGFIGTVVFQSFGLSIARTGLTLERACAHGFNAVAVVVTGLDRAHYARNAQYVTLKLIADAKTGRVLGVQGYGRGDVFRHVQIIACAIAKAMTLSEVFSLDLGYAPEFNIPIDVIQTACLVLGSKMEGFIRTITAEELSGNMGAYHIIDASPVSEHMMNAIPGSVNVPLENLRREGIAFDKTAKCVIYSKTSSRAYEAYRHLASRGYEHVWVLEGGYAYWVQ